jgi:hypothetical protein
MQMAGVAAGRLALAKLQEFCSGQGDGSGALIQIDHKRLPQG